jgi:hypothetical protein
MPESSQTANETPPVLTLVPLHDPVVERLGHRPGSPYVELVWLGILGPSTSWAWQRLARQAAAISSSSLDVADLSLSLGLGESLGRNAMVSRTLARLVAFDAARRQGDVLAVRLALPDLPQRRFSHRAPAVTVTSGPGEPAMAVGL